MKLTSSFAALSAAVVVALCIGQAHAETVNAPLGLSQVNDEGVPITPLTYLNLEPSSKELSDAAKKVTTPPPLPKHPKRLLNPADELKPYVGQLSSPGLSVRAELGHSLIPSLPILGNLDNEGDHRTDVAAPPKKRLVGPLEVLKPGEGTQYLPENHQTLGQRTVHPLNRRADSPVDLSFFGKNLDELAPKLPAGKRATDTGLNLLGADVPLDKLPLPGLKRQADVKPLDLGLKTGNAQDADAAKSLLGGLLPIKRDGDVKPVDLGLKTGNAQDAERANDFLGSLLGGKRDTITPDNLNLDSVKPIVNQGAATVMPIVLNQVKSKASPAVQGIKAANGLCSAFGCQNAVQGALGGVTKELPLPQARALGDKDMFEHGLLGGNGEINGIPVRRADPLTDTVLGASDEARDAILGVKDQADNAAGAFVKNMYSKHGEVQTKRDLTLPGYALLPGTGPMAKEGAQELIDFLDLPVPGLKRMDKLRRKE
ncbi:hypothetical protein PANT_7d00333 [Moesziomyces antarcticus T-34]|uniref:Uncharacterized protein n=1 Tax=Pseudozyma antarctica (strain T-34) TaxID=1151754 RepID=M9LZQ6_PSEA3|nr:hypothetical protein PANT_7d00333 [Moesziomyces antarcticus T-34]